MRLHEAQTPHASTADAARQATGVRQLTSCASAMAVRRLPTPSGPAKMRLGGSVSRSTARASSSRSVAMAGDRRAAACRHPRSLLLLGLALVLLFLLLPLVFLLLVLVGLLVAARRPDQNPRFFFGSSPRARLGRPVTRLRSAVAPEAAPLVLAAGGAGRPVARPARAGCDCPCRTRRRADPSPTASRAAGRSSVGCVPRAKYSV